MDYGIAPLRELTTDPAALAALAQAAEQLGFDSIWLTEHIAVPARIQSRYPYSPDGRPNFGPTTAWIEAMVGLGYLAGLTHRLRLGTAVVPMITRDPLSMAKQAATVDRLSAGRLELGLGAGWLAEEGGLLGHPVDHPGARLEEAIDVMRAAWSQPTFSHHGQFWNYPEIGVHPQPVQGPLPVWIGGSRSRALRCAAERGQGLLSWLDSPERVGQLRSRLDEINPSTRLGSSVRVGPDPATAWSEAQGLAAAGCDLVVFLLPAGAEAALQAVENLGHRLQGG